MQHLKRNLLSVALASATLMLATGAFAQEAAAQQDQAAQNQDQAQETQDQEQAKELETITVTGIRLGIEQSIETKKNSTSIVESVSAEDIGKLPDISIAESIARLPGLAAQRVGGRAQVISVRGLSPDFSTTLLNGREMVSTGDNRSVEFDQYPSELMAGVTVYKTPDAALVGQGLSGTIDMRTVRPLDFDKPVYALSARWQDNSLGSAANTDGDGLRLNASYIDQYMDGELGLAIGFSHSDIPIQEEQTGLYEPWQQAGRPGVPAGTYITDGAKALRRTGYVRRNAVMATAEFRPIPEYTSTLDIFHTSAVQEDTANQFEVNFGYNGSFPCNPACVWTPNVNSNNTLTGGTLTNTFPLVRGMFTKREDSIDAVGWNHEIKLGENTYTADLSWSKSHRDELSLENNAQLVPGSFDTMQLNFPGSDFATLHPTLQDYSNPNALFLANTIYGSGYGKTPRVVDELIGFKVNANFAAPQMFGEFFSDFDVGAHYGNREKSKRQPEGNINLGPQGPTTIGSDLQYGLVDLGFAGVGMIPSWNVPGAVARYMTFAPTEDLNYLVSKAWTVNEDITTAWFRANFDSTWGSVGVRGNLGVQMQHTDQSSNSFYWDATQPAGQNRLPVEDGKSYTDWLPGANIAFMFSHDQTLRFGASRQIARPRLDQMRSSLEFGVSDFGVPGGSGGNPLLDPWVANSYDVSYEKYFGDNKGYVSAAAFYKDLRSYIFQQSLPYDFSKFIAQLPPDELVTTNIGQFTAPYNGEGGSLQGLELTASLPLDLFWDAAEGFGVVASAGFFDSNISIAVPENASSVGPDEIPLPGLSEEVYNLTVYYARGGFEARVNQRSRSDFIGEISNFAAERTLRWVEGENVTDAQLSYSFGEDSIFKGATLLFQASNLTNSGYTTYVATEDRPLENIEWGKTYLLGVSYKF